MNALVRGCVLLLAVIARAALAADAAAPPAAPLPERLDLFVGDARVLDAESRRVAVGNGAIVDVSTIGSGQLLLLAESAGTTTVNLWLRDGRRHHLSVHVTEANLDVALGAVRQMLEGTEGITARVAGARIVLEGDRVADADRRRAAAVTGAFGGLVLDFVGRLGWERMIHFDVRIVEVRRSAIRELGIRWSPQANGPSVGVIADFATNDLFRVVPPPAAVPGLESGPLPLRVSPPAVYAGITSVLNSRIDLLEQRGEAELIAQPTLSCRSGGSARFVAGGEFPIPVLDRNGAADVEFKEYGVILDVKPVADRGGTIYAQIETEVSRIDEGVTVLGVPGLLKRRSQTEINVREGEVVVLAGLVDRNRGRDTQAVPGLGRVPVVGGLFRSRGRRSADTELLVMLTPRLVEGHPDPEALATDPNAAGVERARRLLDERGYTFEGPRLTVPEEP